MTQIKAQELARVVCPPARVSAAGPRDVPWLEAGTFGVMVAPSIAVSAVSLKLRNRC